MKERPILMSAPMVRALHAGTKTQTRRVIKNPDCYACLTGDCPHSKQTECDADMAARCPYGVVGDRLWVRETWRVARWGYYGPNPEQAGDTSVMIEYRADGGKQLFPPGGGKTIPKMAATWRPSIFMPRWACRLVLELTATRAQLVQDIDVLDAIAEGVGGWINAEDVYAELWDKINGKRPGCRWSDNPWVWALTFKVVK